MPRLNNLSFYRIIATICVLQFHVYFILYDRDIPYEMLLSKGVQGLTALSGFLYSQKQIKNVKDFLGKALKKLIPPAIICFALMTAWNLAYMLAFRKYNYISLFFDHRAYNGELLFQAGNYYYLLYIFVCYLLTPYLEKSPKHRAVIAVGVLSIELALSFLFGASIIVSAYLAGYYVGVSHYSDYTDKKYSAGTSLSLLSLSAASFLAFSFLVENSFGTGYLPEHTHSMLINLTSAAFGVVTFFLISYLLKPLNKGRIRLLGYTDALSLNIFLLNQAFMCGAMNVSKYVESLSLGIVLVYIVTICAAALVTALTPLIFASFSKNTSIFH